MTTTDLDGFAKSYYLNAAAHFDQALEDRITVAGIRTYEKWLNGRVLALGYGTGHHVRALAERGVDLEVIEGSPILARHAEADGIRTHLTKFEDFIAGEPYDTVLASHVLEHLDRPAAMLHRIGGWLRPGGTLIAVTPNADSLHRVVGEHMGFGKRTTLSARDKLVGHQRVYDLDGLEQEISTAGFNVEAVSGFFLKTVPNGAMSGWSPELIDALATIPWDPTDLANIVVVARKP